MVAIDGLLERTVRAMVTPGRALDLLISDKPLGAILDREQDATTYRLFAPRATEVHLCLYDTPDYQVFEPEHQRLPPVERYPMWKDPADGVWEISLLGLDAGRYYSFNVDGPMGDGEGFNPLAQIGDPYARAAAHAENNTIVIDPGAETRWFDGWTDGDYATPPSQDVVIYEAHVRDLTMHPSSGVAPPLRGRYEGVLASEGTGTGLDHLKDLGVNMIEFLPLAEFNNGPDGYNWGYSQVFYFAPEASYARDPLRGSQYYEFKRLVNELHRRGFGVILDVVFNHVGSPNIFHLVDKKYYFRLNPDYTYSNFSGCGNDVRTEAPMMRRLIVDNIVYWMKEFHADGFRFDLCELVDLDTMMALRDAARAINPNVLLISEPWSFRGENKHQLKGTGWSAWNNDFRYAAKDFAMGRRNRDWIRKNIVGSVETWAADPRQPVNYLESHDDMALADELCTRPDRDGRSLQEMDVSANRLAATVLFTSLGIPMISEGQEFLRSKRGIQNSYDKGDDVNALRWTDRDRPPAAEALAYYRGLIRLRASPQGAAFRLREAPPPDYYQWIMPPNDQALGYVVNAGHVHDGAAFVVLLNPAGDEVSFSVSFPAGMWKQIGDGRRIDPAGLPDAETLPGPQTRTVRVPGLHSAIFMDGF
ncbi:MAG TPA: alpha-amylase family glycosyl hydrolase [Thermoleophilia bacterium]|nr:alpha-amylase family glycosyl hydrolase [Thermoleophilia bacterium]